MRVYQYANGDYGVGDPSGEQLARLRPDTPAFDHFRRAIVAGDVETAGPGLLLPVPPLPGPADRTPLRGGFTAADVHATTDAERKDAGLRPTGEEMWDAMSKAEQDALVGEKVADAIRRGDIDLADLVDRSADDFITGKPAQDLGIDTEG